METTHLYSLKKLSFTLCLVMIQIFVKNNFFTNLFSSTFFVFLYVEYQMTCIILLSLDTTTVTVSRRIINDEFGSGNILLSLITWNFYI